MLKKDKIFPFIVGLGLIVFQLYMALVRPFHPLLARSIHLCFALSLTFYYKPFGEKTKRYVDVVLQLVIAACALYFIMEAPRLAVRYPYVDDVLLVDKALTIVLTLLVLEAVRRVVGAGLLGVVIAFLAYAAFGPYFPGWLRFGGTSLEYFTELATMTDQGIFGLLLGVSVNEVFYFVLFGALFNVSGGGQLFVDLGLRTTRNTRGGAAKAAVVGSGLFGMISGSAVANVVTTGVFTIPLMKKSGFTPEEAGSVEAVVSTGGQLAPPIMGAAAFIMAEILGTRYLNVAKAAIVPAILYFTSAYLVVHLLATRKDIKADPDMIDTEPVLPRLYLLIPAILLVYFIVRGNSLVYASTRAILAILIIGFISKKHRITLTSLIEAILSASKEAAGLAIPIAASGIVIGVAVQSGLATKVSGLLMSMGAGQLLSSLVVILIGCVILGMALPTVASYSVGSILFAPSLIKLGVLPLAAHMFVFYFSILAQITPPVCVATFAAAGLAHANYWHTGVKAFTFAIPSFLVPFVMVYQPEIMLVGSIYNTLLYFIAILIGVYAMAAGTTGFLFRPIESKAMRAVLIALALATIIPEKVSTIIGVIGFALVSLYEFRQSRLAKAREAVTA